MAELRTLIDGISFGESPRWHDGRLWVCDWAAEELLAVSADGARELIARVPSFPFCIDWLPEPDGRLLAGPRAHGVEAHAVGGHRNGQ